MFGMATTASAAQLPRSSWVNASNGTIPDGAWMGGREQGGEPLYICRAAYQGGVHPGKVRPGLRGCNIGWGGAEITVNSYQVLMPAPSLQLQWHTAQESSLLQVGREPNGAPLYVCHAAYEGGVHLGKVRPGLGGCNIGWGGQEVTVRHYAVLDLVGQRID
jgi:hypothetical protein